LAAAAALFALADGLTEGLAATAAADGGGVGVLGRSRPPVGRGHRGFRTRRRKALRQPSPSIAGGGVGTRSSLEPIGFALNTDYQKFWDEYSKYPRMESWEAARESMLRVSDGTKASIVAMEDKLMLHRLVDGLDASVCPGVERIKQVPIRAWVQWHGSDVTVAAVDLEHAPENLWFKPTHLSNSDGGSPWSKSEYGNRHQFMDFVKTSCEWFKDKGQSTGRISEAGQRVAPGCVVQDMYPKARDRNNDVWPSYSPLELRVQVNWGRGHMVALTSGGHVFIGFNRQRPVQGGAAEWSHFALGFDSSSQKPYPAAHVDEVVNYLRQFLDTVVLQAECLATALGVPWARIDFFVPPPGSTWPVVFNELEVVSGVQWTLEKPMLPAGFKLPTGFEHLEHDDYRHARQQMEWMREAQDAGRKAWEAAGSQVKTAKEVLERFGCQGGEQGYAALRCRGGDLGSGASTAWFPPVGGA